MQTLIPQSATTRAMPQSRAGRVLGFGLTPLALALFAAGFIMAIPAFFHAQQIVFMLAWDGLIAVLVVIDAIRLPQPECFTVTRRFIDSPQLAQQTRVEITVDTSANVAVDMRIIDDLHASLTAVPQAQAVQLVPQEPAACVISIDPRERGDFLLGRVYLHYRAGLRLVERWAVAEPVIAHADNDATELQRVRVFPAHESKSGSTQLYLLRARQIEMQRRKLRMRGIGRDFESMRDYQPGDEIRKISWTATARRGRLVTRQFTVERSQQVWAVLDAGRLSRTAFELRRSMRSSVAETEAERDAAHLLTVTQLDQATTAAIMLAQVVQSSGDKFGMMAYGRDVQQMLLPGTGAAHLRLLIDLLSQTRSEAAEADHLHAVARLKSAQRRRGLIVWITELVDSAGTPELVVASAELVKRHLVVLVLLKHPELEELAERQPTTPEEMFHITAAQEMLERRSQYIAQLERQGVLIVETSASEIGINAINQYLEIKAKGLL